MDRVKEVDRDSGSTVVGLGYPGQGFGSSDGPECGPYYTCDNGQTTDVYVYGTDRTTQVTGDVPLCTSTSSEYARCVR